MTIADYDEREDAAEKDQRKDEFFDYVMALENNLDKAEGMGERGDPELPRFMEEIEVLQKEAEDFARGAGHPSQSLADTRHRIEKLRARFL